MAKGAKTIDVDNLKTWHKIADLTTAMGRKLVIPPPVNLIEIRNQIIISLFKFGYRPVHICKIMGGIDKSVVSRILKNIKSQ